MEKKIILTEEQLKEALRFAAMGGAGLLHPSEITSIHEKLPEEIAKMVLASALVASIIRVEEPGGAILKVLEMVVESRKEENRF